MNADKGKRMVSVHNVTGKGLAGAAPIDGPKIADTVSVTAAPYRLH